MRKIKNRRVRREWGKEVGGEEQKTVFCLSPISATYSVVNIFKSIKSKF